MSQRKKGLWLDNVRVEVETVRTAHYKTCEWCEKVPETRRLKVTRGSARAAVTGVLCMKCGEHYLAALQEEAGRASEFLRYGSCPDGEGIRLPAE